MNFLNLEYFIAVADARNITAAANRLYVSQQSLSEQIKKLEDEIGTKLIVRSRPLNLTPAGRILYDAATQILDTRATALRDIAASLSQRERELKLGISTYETPPLLPPLLTFFVSQYPNISVSVTKQPESTIAANMQDIDLYFSIPPLCEQLDHTFFIRNDYYCLVARKSLFVRIYGENSDNVIETLQNTHDLNSVSDLPFILLKDFTGRTPACVSTIFDSFGIEPVVHFQSDNGELNSSFCLNGAGARVGSFLLMYTRYQEYINQGEDPLLLFPLRTKRNSVQLAISYAKDKALSTAEICFLSAARDFLTNYSIEHFTDSAFNVDHLPSDLFY